MLRLAALFCRACGLSLLPRVAVPCSAFDTSGPHFRHLPARRSDWWRGAAAGPACFWGIGASRARGQGNACGVAGEWAGPTAGSEFGFFRGTEPCLAFQRFSAGPAAYLCCPLQWSHAVPSAHPGRAFRLFFVGPWAYPYRALPASTRLGAERRGGFGGVSRVRALRARGQGDACGVVGD